MKADYTEPQWPTVQELKAYVQGNLNHERAHEIERLALDHPLLAEAIEGYTAMPLFDEVPPWPHTVRKPWWSSRFFWIAGAMAVGVVLWRLSDAVETNSNAKPVLAAKQMTAPEAQAAEPQWLPFDEAPPESAVATAVSETKAGTQLQVQVMDTFSGSPLFVRKAAPEPLPLRGATINTQRSRDTDLQTSALPADEGVRIVHIHHYKLADYTASRVAGWPRFALPAHIPASLEKAGNTPADEARLMPYLDYIYQCIDALNRGHYKLALSHFDNVLSQYPGDVNAQFYSGLAHFRLGQFQKATDLFDRAAGNTCTVFQEDALFYKARALRETGRITESDKLLSGIAASGGFYAAQAAALLRK